MYISGAIYLRDVIITPQFETLQWDSIFFCVAQYTQYRKEVNFMALSRSTMLRVLPSCAAMVRKSLQGVDYIAAHRGKAFDQLIEIVLKLSNDDRVLVSHLQKV